MVFENFGAPIFETFGGHETTAVNQRAVNQTEKTVNQMQVALDEIKYDFDCSNTLEENGETYCRRVPSNEVEFFQGNSRKCPDGSDPSSYDPKTGEPKCSGTTDQVSDDTSTTDQVIDDTNPTDEVEDEYIETEQVEEDENDIETEQVEEDDEDEEDNEDEDDEDTSGSDEDVTSGFTGSMNIEHFSGREMREKATSLSVVLRSVLFACLFYILAHPDTRSYLLRNLKFLKQFDFLTVSMVLFLVLHYVLSIFV